MNEVARIVDAFNRAEEAFRDIAYEGPLKRVLAERVEAGLFLATGVNQALPPGEYLAYSLKTLWFQPSPFQDSPEGLVIDYGDKDSGYGDETHRGTVTIPWAYFGREEAGEEASEAAPPSLVEAKLVEYVEARGIPMPFYNSGSKITEEAEELRAALQAFLAEPSAANLAHLQEEVADVALTAAVAARQAGFTVEAALEAKIEKDRGRGPKPASDA